MGRDPQARLEEAKRKSIPFKARQGRDAWAAIRGFVFQVQLTIKRWIDLEPSAVLELELGEDIDWVATELAKDPKRILEQVKHRKDSISLRSESAREALANAIEHIRQNPEVNLLFRFTTTARIGTERAPGKHKLAGIAAWNELRLPRAHSRERELLGRIRGLLRGTPVPGAATPSSWVSLQKILSTKREGELRDLVRRFEWSTSEPGLDDLEGTTIRTLVERKLARDASDARAKHERLFLFVFQTLSREGIKRLTADQLRAQLTGPVLDDPDALRLRALLSSLADSPGEARIAELFATLRAVALRLEALQLPQPLLIQPGVPHDLETRLASRLYYGARSIKLVGRDSELDALRSFVDDPRQFLWWTLTGPAGSGKSRLALEVAHEIARVWNWGMLRPSSLEHFPWDQWQPLRPTFIVIDYAGQFEGLADRLISLAARARTEQLQHHVRVLLIEREAAGDWWAELRHGTGTEHVRVAEFRETQLHLGELGSSDVARIVEEFTRSDRKLKRLLPRISRLSLGRPLFVAICAQALASNEDIGTWEKPDVLRYLLRQEHKRWDIAGVESHERLIFAIATLTGGIDTSTPQGAALVRDLAAPLGMTRSWKRLSIMSGQQVDPRGVIPKLEPDILGEYFIVDELGSGRDLLDGSVITKRAWTISPTGTAAALRRIGSDFSGNPVAWSLVLLEPPRDCVHEWTRLLRDVLLQVPEEDRSAAIGRLKRAQGDDPEDSQVLAHFAQGLANLTLVRCAENSISLAKASFGELASLAADEKGDSVPCEVREACAVAGTRLFATILDHGNIDEAWDIDDAIRPFVRAHPGAVISWAADEIERSERAIASGLQGAELEEEWIRLGSARRVDGDIQSAIDCYENAIWIDGNNKPLAIRKAISTLEGALGIPAGLDAEERLAAATSSVERGEVLSIRLSALYLESGLTDPTGRGVQAIANAVNATALRAKTRWLLARGIPNGFDGVREQQRTRILAELNARGLTPLDRTSFVLARLTDLSHRTCDVRRGLDALTRRAHEITDSGIKWSSLSLLSLRWTELRDVPRAQNLARESAAACGEPRTLVAVRIKANSLSTLLQTQDDGAGTSFRDLIHSTKGLNLLNRNPALECTLAALSASGSNEQTRELAREALGILALQDPRRTALSLATCAENLATLGVADDAASLSLKLISVPAVARDAQYLGAAVSAFARFHRDRPVPATVVHSILALTRVHMRDLEEVNRGLVAGAVEIGGDEFAREIRDRMRLANATTVTLSTILAWEPALRRLAANSPEESVADVQRAIKMAWCLRNDDDRRRAVRRATSLIPLVGKVEDGLAQVSDVVRRTGAAGIGPYFRAEVLSVCVDAAAKLGAGTRAFEVLENVMSLVEKTRTTFTTGDSTFLFEVLGDCVDQVAAASDVTLARRVIERLELYLRGNWGVDGSSTYWTPYYRYRTLARCARGYSRIGDTQRGMTLLSEVLEGANKMTGLDRIDLLRAIVECLPQVADASYLPFVDCILDCILSERSIGLGDAGSQLLGRLFDEVVSPASRVRTQYENFLGREERSIREKVANEE